MKKNDLILPDYFDKKRDEKFYPWQYYDYCIAQTKHDNLIND